MAIFKPHKQEDGSTRFVAEICRNVTIPEVLALLERMRSSEIVQVDAGDLRASYVYNDPEKNGIQMTPVFKEDMSVIDPPSKEVSNDVTIIIRDSNYTVLSLKAKRSSCLATPFETNNKLLTIDYSKFDALMDYLTKIKTIEQLKKI